jgi:hypothetical protein
VQDVEKWTRIADRESWKNRAREAKLDWERRGRAR